MSIYKVKGSPFWWYDFTVQGKRHRGSTESVKRAEAEAIYAKRRSEALLGNFYDLEKQVTISFAFDRYEQNRASFTSSYQSTQVHIDHLVGYFGEGKLLSQIGQAELTEYVTASRTEVSGRTGRVISPATINRRLATFQGMYNDERLTHGTTVQPIDFRKLKLKEPPPVNNTLSRKDFDRWMARAEPYMRHYLMFAVYSGMRMSNILGLRGEQIDLERRIITTIGKGGKPLTVSIIDELANHIEAHGLHKKKHVITRGGKPIKSIKTAWKTMCRDLKMPKIRRHDLRHTCATWIYEATGDLLVVKEHLHHSDIKTTMRYTHTKKNEQLEKLNKALNPPIRIVK